MPGKHRGRPPKEAVDPDLAAGICKNLELAMPIALAAEAEGVGRRTVYEWMARFEDFSAQVIRARARGARKLVLRALEGGKGSGIATRLLERRYYEDYGKPKRGEQHEDQTVEIIVKGGLGTRVVPTPRFVARARGLSERLALQPSVSKPGIL